MISYKLAMPIFVINGRPTNYCSQMYETLGLVREQIDKHDRERRKFAGVWRLTEEEIDIDKEDW